MNRVAPNTLAQMNGWSLERKTRQVNTNFSFLGPYSMVWSNPGKSEGHLPFWRNDSYSRTHRHTPWPQLLMWAMVRLLFVESGSMAVYIPIKRAIPSLKSKSGLTMVQKRASVPSPHKGTQGSRRMLLFNEASGGVHFLVLG